MKAGLHSTTRALGAILLTGSFAVGQSSVDLTPVRDTSLYEDNQTGSAGEGHTIFAGNNQLGTIRRGLLTFDIAGSIPPGATILSASLTVEVLRTRAVGVDVELHRATSDWGEGNSAAGTPFPGRGLPAGVDDATWLNRMACDQPLSGTMSLPLGGTNVSGVGTLFTTELAAGDLICIGGESFGVMQITNDTNLDVDSIALVAHVNDPGLTTANTWVSPGGDFVAGASASTSVSGVGTYNWSSPAMAADVQAWLDSPASNFGWLIRSDESTIPSAVAIGSLDNPSPSARPMLVVEFAGSPVPTLPGWGSVLLVSLVLAIGTVLVSRRHPDTSEPV